MGLPAPVPGNEQPVIFDTAVTVGDTMVTAPKVCGARTTVAAVRELFEDEHVHAALIVDDGALISVIDRDDLRPGLDPDSPAAAAGRLDGRVIAADVSLRRARRRLASIGRRRFAVVDHDGTLLGLLCLKHHGRGFCSDADVCARWADAGLGRG